MIQYLPFAFTIIVTVVTATWSLRAKLSDIENAIKGHVESDLKKHAELDAKIVKLELRHVRR